MHSSLVTISVFALLQKFAVADLGEVLYSGILNETATPDVFDSINKGGMDQFKFAPGGIQPLSTYYSLSKVPPSNFDPQFKGQQTLSVKIDNSSIFTAGSGATAFVQKAIRRQDLVAKENTNLTQVAGSTSLVTFSVQMDDQHPLNLTHSYLLAFMEGPGGNLFNAETGTPFDSNTVEGSAVQAPDADHLTVSDNKGNKLFSQKMTVGAFLNMGVAVNFKTGQLAICSSVNDDPLKLVSDFSKSTPIPFDTSSPAETHIGIFKRPLALATDALADRSKILDHGFQEGTTEGVLFSQFTVRAVADPQKPC